MNKLSNEQIQKILDGAPDELKWLAENVHDDHIDAGVWLKKNHNDTGYSFVESEEKPNDDLWFSAAKILLCKYRVEILTLRQKVERLKAAEGHIFDMLLGDDGQAYKEAEKYLEKHRPDLIERLNLEQGNE